jgi:hypothetical protein
MQELERHIAEAHPMVLVGPNPSFAVLQFQHANAHDVRDYDSDFLDRELFDAGLTVNDLFDDTDNALLKLGRGLVIRRLGIEYVEELEAAGAGDGFNAERLAHPDVRVESEDDPATGLRVYNLDTIHPSKGAGQGFVLFLDDGDALYASAASLVLTQNEMLDLGMQLLAAAGTSITEVPVEGEPGIYIQTASVYQVHA